MDIVLQTLQSNRYIFALVILVLAFALGFIVDLVITKVFMRLAKQTRTPLDDEIVTAIRRPLFFSVLLIGFAFAMSHLEVPKGITSVVSPTLYTLAILLWTVGGMGIGQAVLNMMARKVDEHKFVQPKSLPLFKISLKTALIGGAAYGLLLAWHVDVTAWLASAGILGIAIGFASKDTLSNLFAGIFILADTPYKIGDFVVLDAGERGRVTDIGIRSTRILTREDVQIIIPNAAIGNAKIINETGGPHKKMRVAVYVGVAYGSDIDKVRGILMDVAKNCENTVEDPPPKVRFSNFGDSALEFRLLAWINEPIFRGQALDDLNTTIYKRFEEEKIQIPFPQRDVHVKREL